MELLFVDLKLLSGHYFSHFSGICQTGDTFKTEETQYLSWFCRASSIGRAVDS